MQVGSSTNVYNSGMQGIARGEAQLNQSAQTIASANVRDTDGDIDKAMVEQKQGQRQVEASTRAIQAENQTLGSLIDIKV
jgi:hypothetical protein